MNKTTIHWICDEPGWAFDVIARLMAKNQSKYNHEFYYANKGISKIKEVPETDLIVCLTPPYAMMIEDKKNVVVCTSGHRFTEFTKDDKNSICRKLSQVELEPENSGITAVPTG